MARYRFDQLVDISMIQRLLESHHRLSGMAYGLLDTDGNMLVTVGWQGICERFHRVNPAKAYMQAHMHEGEGDYTKCGCGHAQGFLFGRPMPWDKFEAFLGGAAVTI